MFFDRSCVVFTDEQGGVNPCGNLLSFDEFDSICTLITIVIPRMIIDDEEIEILHTLSEREEHTPDFHADDKNVSFDLKEKY